MTYQWAVIGGGPAGIAAVGKLLDHGVNSKEIVWIDPKFSVGDFGTLWTNVPSNTKVELFQRFLHACESFNYKNCSEDFELNHVPRNKTCQLRLMADPLQWITNQFKNKVHAFQDVAQELTLSQRAWNIRLKENSISAKQVILAMGADAKNLAFPSPTFIPLSDAMDSNKIKDHLHPDETVGVFGSSHSAILVLRNLLESSAKKIINFYRSPLIYAVYFDDWILFDDTGLKGPTAEWARQHLQGELPHNLIRIYSNEENIQHYLPQCDKVIYAVGFERRTLPIIDGVGQLNYMAQTGIIAPGLFGLGIAFPEAKYNPLGMLEYRVGLWKFMDYLQRIMPIWLAYSV